MKINKLEDRVAKLESEVLDESKERTSLPSCFGFNYPIFYRSLREIAKDNEKRIDKLDSKLQAILDHLGQEYVEITEKNGDTKTFHKLRKKNEKR